MRVQSFESVAGLMAALRENTEDAKRSAAKVSPETLAKLACGGHYVTWCAEGFPIFGEVVEAEYEEDRVALADQPWRRLVKAYSVACPQGELGTVFVSNMFPITQDEFEAACQGGWTLEDAGLAGRLAAWLDEGV